jgi:hypothetical protein
LERSRISGAPLRKSFALHRIRDKKKRPKLDHVYVGREEYLLSADGKLMPVGKGQAPPDLRYFNQTRK